jgi:hypothetical protein
MLKKPSILACLGIYCSVFADFALFTRSCVFLQSFTEAWPAEAKLTIRSLDSGDEMTP